MMYFQWTQFLKYTVDESTYWHIRLYARMHIDDCAAIHAEPRKGPGRKRVISHKTHTLIGSEISSLDKPEEITAT